MHLNEEAPILVKNINLSSTIREKSLSLKIIMKSAYIHLGQEKVWSEQKREGCRPPVPGKFRLVNRAAPGQSGAPPLLDGLEFALERGRWNAEAAGAYTQA